jgi:hypothetical protein
MKNIFSILVVFLVIACSNRGEPVVNKLPPVTKANLALGIFDFIK